MTRDKGGCKIREQAEKPRVKFSKTKAVTKDSEPVLQKQELYSK